MVVTGDAPVWGGSGSLGAMPRARREDAGTGDRTRTRGHAGVQRTGERAEHARRARPVTCATAGDRMDPVAAARREVALDIQRLAEEFERSDEAAFYRTRLVCWAVTALVTILAERGVAGGAGRGCARGGRRGGAYRMSGRTEHVSAGRADPLSRNSPLPAYGGTPFSRGSSGVHPARRPCEPPFDPRLPLVTGGLRGRVGDMRPARGTHGGRGLRGPSLGRERGRPVA